MNGPLPTWVERLLGIEPEYEEGTIWGLEHAWNWAPWVTLLFVVFAVVFIVTIYLREGRRVSRRRRIVLAGIRLCLVALVCLMISQLALSLKRTGLPYVAVVIDVTESMTIVDHYEPQRQEELQQRLDSVLPTGEDLSRWNLAKVLLTEEQGELLRAIAADYKLRAYLLEDSPRGVRSSDATSVEELLAEIEAIERPTVGSSRYGAAMDTVLDELRGLAPAAIVLVGDGINTEGATLGEVLARQSSVPVFAVGLGSNEPA